MNFKLTKAAVMVSFVLGAEVVYAEPGEIEFFGNVYAKFLDGDRRGQNGLYNEAEFGGGDQGQGTEFELLFKSAVSRQVEIGGRLKGRFNKNYWSNFGGFGGGCEVPVNDDGTVPADGEGNGAVVCEGEFNPTEGQYLKVRGVYARITPGYDWIDSLHIGSHDLGLFDPFTIGKIRYIDRDNAGALIAQGSNANKSFRWDVARVSLPRLWAGAEWSTGDFHAQDSAWAAQGRYSSDAGWNVTTIVQYIDDQEIDTNDQDARDGISLTNRARNSVLGLKGNLTAAEDIELGFAVYHSRFDIDTNCGTYLDNACRWSPVMRDDETDVAYKLNFDLSNVFLEDLTMRFEYFHIGAYYTSLMAARRESDVLLTEGRGGTWGWWRPDYNDGNVGDAGRNQYSVGYGGWNGGTHQVATINADNAFTDFDEGMAESVIGWKGVTWTTDYSLDDWNFHTEVSFIDYDTNWQACGGESVNDCILPRIEGTNSWGLGGAYRSVYSPYQERETTILVLKADYAWDVLDGLDLGLKYKYMDDSDERVTGQEGLVDAYAFTTVSHVNHDDREAEYHGYEINLGKQINDDFYAKILFEIQTVDLFDGTIEVSPPGGADWEGRWAWIEYLTGDHVKYRTGVQLSWNLSGVEFGLSADYIFGEYDPEFYTGNADGSISELAAGVGIGENDPYWNAIPDETVDIDQYRMKAFMKVSF